LPGELWPIYRPAIESVEPRLICSRCRRKGCAIVLLDAEGQDVPYQMGRG
jgi:hypothetical protein